MPDSTFDAQSTVFANGVALTQDLSELASILGSIGISGEGGHAASEDRAGELVQTASKVLRGLMRQLDGIQIQRNMLASYAEDWFWQWDMVSGVIRIETPPSLRGPKKRHETKSWGVLIHPDDESAISSINGFSVSGHDHLQIQTRMRSATGEWGNVVWQGRIAERDKAGIGMFAAGTLKLLRKQPLSAGQATERDDKRAKLDFLANISHEIRTPMTAILGAAYLAMEINDPFQQKELARTIKASTESLVELLDDALDFTKLEAGMVALETVEFDFHTLMAETAKIYQFDAQRKGLKFFFRIAPNIPARVVSDPVRIRQIVANLLGNAVKFTNGGEIEFAVNAQAVSGRECQWAIEISIRDTGIGIPADKQSAIFEMFTQADASTTRKFGGTGIGLSICKHLASLLGGVIRVESKPGKGSVFYLNIFAKSASAGEVTTKPLLIAGKSLLSLEKNLTQREPNILLDANIGALCAEDKPKARVLLAEDNPTSRDVIAAILRRAGYKVDAVANGAEAVEAYQLEPFAFGIVLMDIQMPVMDGFEAAEGIRACEERRSWVSTGNWRGTPILAMTADALKNIDSRCRDAGMNGVLIKPSTPEVLFATIEQTIAEAENDSERKAFDAVWQHHRPDEIAQKQAAINELSMRLDKTLLDLRIPLEWVGKDLRALKQLISSFREDVPKLMLEVDRQLAEMQLAGASRLLHRMKSSLKILGAGEACRLTEALSDTCNAKEREQATLGWTSLRESLLYLIQLLEIVYSTL